MTVSPGSEPAAAAPPVGVLIVDDQQPFRSAARTLVSLLRGWEVVAEVETGEDAVRVADETGPDVVLMDINLPGISGIEATRRIVDAHPGMRIVLLSTYTKDDLPDDAMDCGAVGYLRKEDLTPRALREAVLSPTP